MNGWSWVIWVNVMGQTNDPSVSFVPADSYAIRRFAEVIDHHVQNSEVSPRERLIQLRARLLLADQKLDENEGGASPDKPVLGSLTKESQRKSLEALQDHLKKQIKKIERQITQKKSPKTAR
jgi:hypothetical protein